MAQQNKATISWDELMEGIEPVEFEMCAHCDVLFDKDTLEDGLCEDCITIPASE